MRNVLLNRITVSTVISATTLAIPAAKALAETPSVAVPRIELLPGKIFASESTITVAAIPNKQKYLYALMEYFPDTCVEVSSGAWTVDTPPKYGNVSFGTISGHTSNGTCPDTVFTFAAIYYTLTKPATQSDFLNATWRGPDFTLSYTFNLIVPSLNIISEDITTDSIVIDPEPSGMSGSLKITPIGDKASPVVVNQTVVGGAKLTLKYGEITKPLPVSHYTKLQADWTINGLKFSTTKDINFTALGLYQNTVYNIPHESQCAPPALPVTLWKTGATCVSRSGKYRSQFISQTLLNGTGVPLIGGYTAREQFCTTASSTDFRQPFTPQLACTGKGLGDLNDTTIAVNRAGGVLRCNDRVLFVGERATGKSIGIIKTATDNCPACASHSAGTTGHVDNFTTSTACSGTSLPNYQAIRLGR